MQDLQSYITFFESKLSSFSFDELTSKDAHILQSSLNDFKKLLDDAIKKKELSAVDNSQGVQFTEPLPKIDPMNTVIKILEGEVKENALFLANTGQQFMIPAKSIINAIENLQDTDLNNKQKSILHGIKFSSQLMLDTSVDILEYSSLGTIEERKEPVEFKFYSIIRDVLFLCNTLITGRNLKIETEIDSNIPTLLVGNPEKLSQILMNLIGNAIKSTQEGTILLKIGLKEEYLDNFMLEFDVCHNGNGISDEDIKSVFNPYRNIHSKEKNNQPDFTLSIVKKLVQSLGGHIYASSRLGVGTVFTLTMPVKYYKMEETISQVSSESIQDLKILVFEDNELNKKIIDVKLSKWKCKTFITDNVEEGIKIMEQKNIDIVLMDIMMPKMDGYEITSVIRSHENKAINTTPIIAVTADNIHKNKEAYISKGLNDYLIKPFNSEELFQKLIQYKPVKNNMGKVENLETRDNTVQEIDLKTILEDCMGNVELLEELIGLYQQNALEFIGKTKVFLQNSNFEGIAQCAHKIKNGLAMVGTKSLLDIVNEIETNAKTDKDTKYIDSLYKIFVQDYQEVEELIFTELEQLKNK